MIPYAEFSYFLFLLYPLALLVILGLLGWLRRGVILAVSVGILVFQFADPLGPPATQQAGLHQLTYLVGYLALGILIVGGFGFIRRRRRSRAAFWCALAFAIVPLVVVKAAPLAGGFLGAKVAGNGVPSVSLFDVIGFLGISYMTFRVVDAIIILEDGLAKNIGPLDLATYLLFAPTISAGPIDRYRRFSGDLWPRRPGGRAYLRDVEAGIHRIFQGFLYKFILAYLISRYALGPVGHVPGLLGTLGYMYAYSFFLFFDFAGYSAFAIGVGRFFGVQVPENFDRPFLSRDFKEMWNRWHITLSWWLRDHVYMRFILTATKRHWFGGNRQTTSRIGIFLTMALMGAWHGLVPHYLVYGAYQGSMLVAYDVVGRWKKAHGLETDPRVSRVVGTFLTFNLFCFGLLIFSGHLFS